MVLVVVVVVLVVVVVVVVVMVVVAVAVAVVVVVVVLVVGGDSVSYNSVCSFINVASLKDKKHQCKSYLCFFAPRLSRVSLARSTVERRL